MIWRGTRLGFLLVAIAAVFACAPAGAATLPGEKSLALQADQFVQPAFDGGDVYSAYSRTVKLRGGIGSDTIVRRTSFLDGTSVPVYHAVATDWEDVVGLKAGGGVVAISISRSGVDPDGTQATEETEIIRVNRDGGAAQSIASGKLKFEEDQSLIEEGGKSKPNDCGTAVELSDVSATGEVFYANVIRERATKACGEAVNQNRWNFFGVSLSGATRQILSTSAGIRPSFKPLSKGGSGSCDCVGAGARSIEVNGDWALVQSRGNVSLLNLTTGAMVGPYRSADLLKDDFREASLDSHGRVLMWASRTVDRGRKKGKRARFKVTKRTTLFPAPADPNLRVDIGGNPYATGCGDGFYSLTFGKGNNFTVSQLDSQTGGVTRVIGTFTEKRGYGLAGCSAGYLYVGRPAGKRTMYRAIPLG